VQLSRYYGERSYFGISVSGGREVENVGPPLGITSTRIRAVGFVGRHWITPDWALSYELGAHEQGSLYQRRGLRLGLRRSF
jgi:YaiO family outer membrane protein